MHRRIAIVYIMLLLCCFGLMYRLAALTTGDAYLQASTTQSTYSLWVGDQRGTIYDRNLSPLVNQTTQTTLSVAPTPYALIALQQQLPADQFSLFHPILTQGKPLLINSAKPIYSMGITSFTFPIRYNENQLASHIIGYLDSSKNGVIGIEKGYNEQLQNFGGYVQTKYQITATGTVLGEDVIDVVDTRPTYNSGVVLTLDKRIQQMVEQKASVLPQGAVVVMEIDTGEILASASFPTYNPLDVGSALQQENSPMINRATTAYSVGSTFKLVVAAAALDTGYTTDYSYICSGRYQLLDTSYACHVTTGHWEISMWRAVQQSCNPYFINLGLALGTDTVCRYASSFGFGTGSLLAPSVISATGNLPPANTITQGELANISFGQGKLLATPVQITQLSAIIANGGQFVAPTITKGITLDGVTVAEEQPTYEPYQVISLATARTLQELMISVVDVGSGHQAVPTTGGAGGKTATAQTGTFKEGGTEVVHGWFTGFYPAQDPVYAITVFEQDGTSGGQLPAQVFADICDGLAMIDDPLLTRFYKQYFFVDCMSLPAMQSTKAGVYCAICLIFHLQFVFYTNNFFCS